MTNQVTAVDDYVAALPTKRREAISAIRSVILENIDPGFEEGIQYGMISYYVPFSAYPAGYHCDKSKPVNFASLGSQKNHMAIYLMCVYGNPAHEKMFRDDWALSGKKLDMGKSCVRFKRLEDVALDAVAKTIRRVSMQKYIEHYQAALDAMAATKKARAVNR
jgi:hypothetical protein